MNADNSPPLMNQRLLVPCEDCTRIFETGHGFCLRHGYLKLNDEELREARRRSETVVRRYALTPIQPRTETMPEPISEANFLRLQDLKAQLDKKDMDGVVDHLVTEAAYRLDPVKTVENRRPLLVVGPPESGKTRLIRTQLLPLFEKVFVVDVSHEYEDLELVSTGDVLGNAWTTKPRFRLYPADNPLYSDLEMSMTFGILLGKMKEPDSPLKDYVVVFEDAVRFAHVQSIRSFIAESRKFLRKVIVACQDPHAFEGLGEMLKA